MRFFSFLLISLVSIAACSQHLAVKAGSSALDSFLKGSSKPAVIKFYADWCDSCKVYQPTFSKAQVTHSKSVDFYSVNVDDPKNQALMKQFKISRIPVTYFISKDRLTINKRLGPISGADLQSNIKRLLI